MSAGRPVAWRWIQRRVVLAVHDRQLAEHGGLDGIRDAGAIDAALARPRHLATYGTPDAAALAAAYAYGLAKNHGFADGNKRAAWVTARVFLADNGYDLVSDGAMRSAPWRTLRAASSTRGILPTGSAAA